MSNFQDFKDVHFCSGCKSDTDWWLLIPSSFASKFDRLIVMIMNPIDNLTFWCSWPCCITYYVEFSEAARRNPAVLVQRWVAYSTNQLFAVSLKIYTLRIPTCNIILLNSREATSGTPIVQHESKPLCYKIKAVQWPWPVRRNKLHPWSMTTNSQKANIFFRWLVIIVL